MAGGGGGGGSRLTKEEDGCWLEILKRTLKSYQDTVLWAWLDIFFFPHPKDTNFYTAYCLLSKFFRLNTSPRWARVGNKHCRLSIIR